MVSGHGSPVPVAEVVGMDVEAIPVAFPCGQPGKENRRMGVFPLFRFFPSNTEFVGFLPEVLTVRFGRNFKRFFAGFP